MMKLTLFMLKEDTLSRLLRNPFDIVLKSVGRKKGGFQFRVEGQGHFTFGSGYSSSFNSKERWRSASCAASTSCNAS